MTAKRFIGIYNEAKVLNKFDVELFFKVLKNITICDSEMLIVNLLDETEIEV